MPFAILLHDLIHKLKPIKVQDTRIPLVVTYNLSNPNVVGLVTKYWPIQSTTHCASLLKKPASLRFQTKHKSAGQIGQNETKTQQRTAPTIHKRLPCTRHGCQSCKLIKRCTVLPQNNQQYKLAKNLDYNTYNVINLIDYNMCNKQYVGKNKSKCSLPDLKNIRHNRHTPVSKHYNLSSHKQCTNLAYPIPTILTESIKTTSIGRC